MIYKTIVEAAGLLSSIARDSMRRVSGVNRKVGAAPPSHVKCAPQTFPTQTRFVDDVFYGVYGRWFLGGCHTGSLCGFRALLGGHHKVAPYVFLGVMPALG